MYTHFLVILFVLRFFNFSYFYLGIYLFFISGNLFRFRRIIDFFIIDRSWFLYLVWFYNFILIYFWDIYFDTLVFFYALLCCFNIFVTLFCLFNCLIFFFFDALFWSLSNLIVCDIFFETLVILFFRHALLNGMNILIYLDALFLQWSLTLNVWLLNTYRNFLNVINQSDMFRWIIFFLRRDIVRLIRFRRSISIIIFCISLIILLFLNFSFIISCYWFVYFLLWIYFLDFNFIYFGLFFIFILSNRFHR